MSPKYHGTGLFIQFSYLTHEIRYDSMEDGVLQPEAFLSGAQSSEVLCCLGNDVREQLDGNGSQRFTVGCHSEEHQWIGVSGVLLDSGHVRSRGR